MNNSVFLSFASNLILKALEIYKSSHICKFSNTVAEGAKTIFAESTVLRSMKAYKTTSIYFEHSLFLRIIQGVIDWLLGLSRKLSAFLQEPCKSSLTCRLLQNSLAGKSFGWLMEHFVIIICIFIFIHSIVPFHNWHNQYGAALIILITGLYIVKASGDIRYGLDIKRLDFALILFVISTVIATLTSMTPASSLKFLIFNGMSFLIVLVIVNVIKSKEEIGVIIYWIIAAITVTCLLGFWQYIRGIPVDPLLVDVRFGAVGRVFSSMGNPNNYAEYLLLTIPFYAAAFFNAKNIYLKFSIAALAVLPLINLVLTGSRGSWIGFVAAVFVFVFLKKMRLIPWIIILGLAAIPFAPSVITDRLNTIGKDSSSLYRLKIWSGSWNIVENYWLSGVGLGPEPFKMLFNKYTDIKLPAHSHMLPLQIWIELGFLGILSFVYLIVRLVKQAMASVFERRNDYLNNIIIAGISAMAGILTIGLVEYVWFYERIMIMFWIDVGILFAALNLDNLKGGIPLPKE